VILEAFTDRYVYFMTVALLIIGLYGMLGKRNLLKKLIGMIVFQTAVFLFFIEGATKFFIENGTKLRGSVPVIDPQLGTDPALYVNPLPHVLILTAIVVSVATTGVALALLLTIHRGYQSLDEKVILERMRQ